MTIKKAAFGANVPDWCKNVPWAASWSRQHKDVCQGAALHLWLPQEELEGIEEMGSLGSGG